MMKKTIAIALLSAPLIFSATSSFAVTGAIWDKRSYLPFEVISSIADKRINKWINRPSEITDFTLRRPLSPVLPAPKTLIKKEFETTQQFETRVAIEQRNYDTKVLKLEKKYNLAKSHYSQALKEYKLSTEIENRRRKAASIDLYWKYVFEAFSEELGEPLIKLIEYNADLGIFYAVLTSSRSLFSQWLAIKVPLDQAENIQSNADQLLPVLRFDKNTRNKLIISNAHVSFGKRRFPAQLVNKPNELSKKVQETVSSQKAYEPSGDFL